MKNIENPEQNNGMDTVGNPRPHQEPSPVLAATTPQERPKTVNRRLLPRQWYLHTAKDFKPFYYRLGTFPKDPYPGVARWKQLGLTDENISKEKIYTSNKYVLVDKVPNEIARQYIRHNHYLKNINAAEITYGFYVFKKPEYKEMYLGKRPYPEKFNTFNVYPVLIGVAIYGNPVGAHAWNSISDVIKNSRQVKELKRLFIADNILNAMKNGESKLISDSIAILKNDYPDVKAIVTYAASDQLHRGTIYQAANFKFQPTSAPPTNAYQAYSQKTKKTYADGWTQQKGLSVAGIRSNEKSLKEHFGYPVALKKYSYKFRYIYIITKGRSADKQIKEFEEGANKYPISNRFPAKRFIDEQHKTYSKLKVWYSKDEYKEYKSNLYPEKFLIHPDEFIKEKEQLEKRLAEINQHLDNLI